MFVQLTLTIFLVLSATLFQNQEEYPATPTEVVRQYCDFDLNTGRISSANFAKLPPLVTWEVEPGWDTVTVVSGFRIVSSKQFQRRALVAVNWDVLGYSEGENVKKERKSEVVDYKLRLVKGVWKIESPAIPPHVSLPTVRAFVLSQFKKEPERQAKWLKSLDTLAKPVKKD